MTIWTIRHTCIMQSIRHTCIMQSNIGKTIIVTYIIQLRIIALLNTYNYMFLLYALLCYSQITSTIQFLSNIKRSLAQYEITPCEFISHYIMSLLFK